ncbi:MAG: XylR N-terminal domain-containing protein, partial [Betaproteobacteria bacterium]|nr:XylR N-terminal domain-containing protein [Betaproteobacteria bacterium]
MASRQYPSSPAPDIQELAARLQFHPGKGEIRLDNQRMLLLHNSSMAALRRELIE